MYTMYITINIKSTTGILTAINVTDIIRINNLHHNDCDVSVVV